MEVRRKYNLKNTQSNDIPIQVYHEQKMNEFNKMKTIDKPQLIKKLNQLETELKKLENIDIKDRAPNECYSITQIKREIKQQQEQLFRIDDEKDLIRYFSDTHQYINVEYQPQKMEYVEYDMNEYDKSKNEMKTESDAEKNYRQYVSVVDTSNPNNMILHDKKYTHCMECKIPLDFDEDSASMICSECGAIQKILIDSQKPSYEDSTYESGSYVYKRTAHLIEKLSQAQAKETADIPEEIYHIIKLEMGKEGIINMVDLTEKRIRRYLKTHNYSKFYEHIPFIIKHLNGLPPLNLTQHMENEIKRHFIVLENAYELLKRTSDDFNKLSSNIALTSRKNFLSYDCVINRVCLGLGYYDVMQYFPLLKSQPNLEKFFEAWDILCNHLKKDYPVFEKAMKHENTIDILHPSLSTSNIENSGLFNTVDIIQK